ncbi:MAG: uracil-DNA glycosylase [Deltaproteobacteria bacterium]|nr:uracil-DNA glycosylase [Deltaproteobacteria bacterium]
MSTPDAEPQPQATVPSEPVAAGVDDAAWAEEPVALLLGLAAALRWQVHAGADVVAPEGTTLDAEAVARFFGKAPGDAATGAGDLRQSGRSSAPQPRAALAEPPGPRRTPPPSRNERSVSPPADAQASGAGPRLRDRPRLIAAVGGVEPPASEARPATPRRQQVPAPADPAAAIAALHAKVGDCERCGLCRGRQQIVHGRGLPDARVLFVTGGVGSAEDAAGSPVAGEESALLQKMLGAIGLGPASVWIAPLVRCRLPGDGPARRAPSRAELRSCAPILAAEVDIVRPAVLVGLGEVAARFLLQQPSATLPSLRERWHEARGTPTLVTWSPADLLADPERKRQAWVDLQEVARRLADRPDRGR